MSDFFIRLAYGVVSGAGYDTSNMDVGEVIEKFNELNVKDKSEQKETKEYISFNDAIDARKVLLDDVIKWKEDIGYINLVRIKEYTTNSYKDINNYMRNGKLDKPIDIDALNRLISNISESIDKFELKENISVYRAFNFQDISNFNLYEDKAFLSTSASYKDALKFKEEWGKDSIFKINISKGKGKGVYLEPVSSYSYENEFLINKDCKIKIKRYTINEDNILIVEGDLIDE